MLLKRVNKLTWTRFFCSMTVQTKSGLRKDSSQYVRMICHLTCLLPNIRRCRTHKFPPESSQAETTSLILVHWAHLHRLTQQKTTIFPSAKISTLKVKSTNKTTRKRTSAKFVTASCSRRWLRDWLNYKRSPLNSLRWYSRSFNRKTCSGSGSTFKPSCMD
jgi:hypothetical protein